MHNLSYDDQSTGESTVEEILPLQYGNVFINFENSLIVKFLRFMNLF